MENMTVTVTPSYEELNKRFRDVAIALATHYPGQQETADRMARPFLILTKLRSRELRRQAEREATA